jgi:hypothetical protein
MHSYSNLYTFASYKNSVSFNFSSNNYPTLEPTLEPPPPPLRIESNACICKIERNNDDKILIVATSITSSLFAVLFFLLIWYKFIFKKNLLKWSRNNDDANFGFGYNET